MGSAYIKGGRRGFVSGLRGLWFHSQGISGYSTDQTTLEVVHNLGVDWPQVTVYRTTSKAIIYADVVYTDANRIQISGNAPLGEITVVVSP